MQKISILAILFLITLSSCSGTTAISVPQGDAAATLVAGMPTAFASEIPGPVSPVALSPSTHEYVIYSVKRVEYSMSNYEAGLQNIPIYQYVHEQTTIYSYDLENRRTTLLFSDETLPIFVLNSHGGEESATLGIIATARLSGKLYARMLQRDQYTSYNEQAGSLYELATDGTNQYKKVFDFEKAKDTWNFRISPDDKRIAYLSGNFLVVRNLDSGKEVSRIDLGRDRSRWISRISWSPDSRMILINNGTGDPRTATRETTTNAGCYLVNISDQKISKLADPVFQTQLELTLGYRTDPFSYSYFPNSNQLIGIAKKPDGDAYLIKLYSVDLEGYNLREIPLEHNRNAWYFKISPSEKYIAYQDLEKLYVTDLHQNFSEVISEPVIIREEKVVQQQAIVGWLEK